MTRCPRCGQDNPSEAQFCMRCGTALSQTCPRCGTANPPDARFCLTCGAPLGSARATERRVLTVVFADLVGSTSLATGLDPEQMRAMMSEYFDAMKQEIERHGGVVEKFIGDAVMAVFGLPTAHEDDPERAVRCATAMQGRLESLNVRLRASLRLRIGISTGEVVADPQAVPEGQLMVTGEVVNQAARLQEQAPAGGILVDERTYLGTRGVIQFRQVPAEPGVDFADRARWEVVGVLDRPTKRPRAPLVGRDDEMQVLLAIYRRVLEDQKHHLVTIIGAAGVGKTRLAAEFIDRIGVMPEQPAILRGRCPAYGEGLTYWPLAEMLKQESGIKDSDPADVAAAKLQTMVLTLCEPLYGRADGESTVRALASVLGIRESMSPDVSWAERLQSLKRAAESPRPVPSERGDGDGLRTAGDDVLRALRTFLACAAARGPLVLVFEDLHWAEPSLLDLLERLAIRGLDAAIFTLCLARPDLMEAHPGWGARVRNYASVSLSPLNSTLSRRLVTELPGGQALPGDVRDAILSRAEGNPFFIEEIVRMLIDTGGLVEEAGRWRWTSQRVEIRLPDTIHATLTSRLDLLSALEKRVIQVASVAGRSFWAGALAVAGEISPAEASVALGRLQERELIEERAVSSLLGEREFMFRHALIREVVYASLPKAARTEAHVRLARWLLDRVGEDTDDYLEVLAHHYEHAWRYRVETGGGAEDLARTAIGYLRRAAARAHGLRTLPEARRLTERSLKIARRSGLEQDRALMAELLTEHAEVVKWMTEPDAVIQDTETVLRLAREIERPDLVARAWLNRAFAEYLHGRLQPAEDALQRALDLFRARGDRQGETEGLEILGRITENLRDRLSKAQSAYRRALDLYRELNDRQGMARTMASLGRSLINSGHLADAPPFLEEARVLGREHHERISEAASVGGLAILAHLTGDHEAAVRHHRETIRLMQELGDPIGEAAAHRHLAMHYLRYGKVDAAGPEAEAARRIYQEHSNRESAAITRALAEVTLAQGDLLAAADLAERSLALVQETDTIQQATHSATLGKVRAAQGQAEEAERLFRRSLELLEGEEYRIDLALALLKYGESLMLLGEPGRGRERLDQARALFAEMGAAKFVEVIHQQLATGRPVGAFPEASHRGP